jgi:hypothetical protein
MEKIEIDGKLYAFHINLRYGRVYAEIYYMHPGNHLEYQVAFKEFYPFWNWQQPKEKHFVAARTWAYNQIEMLKDANK